MKKKDRGGTGDSLIVTMIAVSIMFIVAFSLTPFFRVIETKMEINQVGREYILLMETQGYLDTTSQANLIKEVKEISGVGTVSVASKTTKTRVGYGEPIYLDFTVNFTYEDYAGDTILRYMSVFRNASFECSLKSIAKY